ncbi:MAG: PilT protein domain protein [Bacteriovoracaceae bacterium]|nr:PilT protein domain protein [Bacteriovoracaceae bacterium]
MNLALDVNAAVAFVMGQDETHVIDKFILNADYIFVPELFIFETSNVFWKLHKLQNLSLKVCENFMAKVLDIPDEIVSGSILYSSAWKLATELHHSTYDMFYLALAAQESAALLTRDKCLKELAQKMGIKVL